MAEACQRVILRGAVDLPEKNSSYKRQEYWDRRFSKEDNFEWCKSYKDFEHLINEHVNRSDRILILGCGNSSLSEDMYRDGYRNIVNIDFSAVVIENMKRKCKDLTEMQWMVMDMTNMTFPEGSFEVIIEKATLDALMVEERDPWNPTRDIRNSMDCVLSQVSKILKDGGRFISVTFSQPHFRKPFLAKLQYNWSISQQTFGESFHFFFYVMEKGRPMSDEDKELEIYVENKTKHDKDNKGENEPCCRVAEDTEDFLFYVAL